MKTKKGKQTLNFFIINFGATAECEFEIIEEGGGMATLPVKMESGDCFVCNSLVKNLSYKIKRVTEDYSQKLVLRPGSLFFSAEKD